MLLKFRKIVEVNRSEVLQRNVSNLYTRTRGSSTHMTVKKAVFWTDEDHFRNGNPFVFDARRPKSSLVLMYYFSFEAHRREPQIMYRIRSILFLADKGARLNPYTPSGLFWILREEEEQDSEHNYLYELFVEKRRAEANTISYSSWTFWRYETNCGR
jgi:hypothetical protein